MPSSSDARAAAAWRLRLPWPLPALAAWAAAWALFAALAAYGTPAWLSFTAAALLGAALGRHGATPWRRLLIGAGFPVSLAASGLATAIAPWAWLLPLAALMLLYPLRNWRDAPIFPTPAGALTGLSQRVALAPGARVLDAGCGLGDALQELRREYPQVRLEGVESSLPLAWIAALRCRFALVHRGDLWRTDWSALQLVYLFQRPESMTRAVAKARAELGAGAWLASLEFEAAGLRPQAVHACADGRSVWLYRAPFEVAA